MRSGAKAVPPVSLIGNSFSIKMATGERLHSASVLDQLTNGTVWFEYVETEEWGLASAPFASISAAFSSGHKRPASFFARIRPLGRDHQPRLGTSPALKKVEYHSVRPIAGDGRCMFRALVVGMATNKGQTLSYMEEEQEAGHAHIRCLVSQKLQTSYEVRKIPVSIPRPHETYEEKAPDWRRYEEVSKTRQQLDQLRLAVMDAICKPEQQRSHKYEEALIAITVEESLSRYCKRIPSPTFWGGESELLVLSKMCGQPIIVYIPEAEAKQGGRWGGGGYIPIAEYGSEYKKPGKDRKARKPVRLLYSGRNHYDLLL